MADINKSLMDKINQGRQYRSMMLNVEKRENEEAKYLIKGYAATFNDPYVLYEGDGWEYREQIDPHAFDDTDTSDVILQFDHEGRVYARGSNGTLSVKPDEHGLFVEADLSGTEDTRKLYEEIQKGYITKMSFGFTVAEDADERKTENGIEVYTRTIKKVARLYDVSVVSLPANDGTEVSTRSLINGVIEARKKEQADRQEQADKEEMDMRERRRKAALALY